MSGMTESAAVKRINAQCSKPKPRTAKHIPTNHLFEVVLEIPGAGVELVDLEGRAKYATWAAWTDGDLWRVMP
ncbi:hypothetical protein [Pseudomonas sp. F(2018)]|uniref:hypothetical protein n=1 Tax=Pseudomonas sp. F(2018) TaxID=2502240 RepID=UPI0010F6A57F|nr:hypothetical protein [Pseudomonas sp. F(2018)]